MPDPASPPRGPGPRVRRLLLALAVVAAAVLLGVRPARKALRGNDFGAYHAAARAVLAGEDPYDARSARGFAYLYPPTLAVLLAPLAPLPEPTAALAWLALKLALLAVVLWRLATDLPGPARPPSWVVPAAAYAVVWTLVDNELNNGQADLLVLGTIVLAGALFVRGRPLASGLAVALGACLKVTPLLFALWFLRRGSARALLGLALGLGLFAWAVPALALGPQGALDANRRFLGRMVAPYLAGRHHDAEAAGEALGSDEPGYSLRAVVARALGAGPAGDAAAARAEWAYRALALAFVLAAVLAAAPARRPPGPGGTWREVGLFAATMVVVAPLSRAAHFVVLLPAAAWIAAVWWRGRRPVAGGVLLVAGLLIEVPFLILPPAARRAVAGGGALLAGALVLLGALLAARSRAATRDGPSTPGSLGRSTGGAA